MRKIKEIVFVEGRLSKDNVRYYRTHALLDDGTEATGFGREFKVNDEVEVFYHHETVKMQKPKKNLDMD